MMPTAHKFTKRGSDHEIQGRRIESPVLSVFESNIIDTRQISQDISKRMQKCHSSILELGIKPTK
jgi:predicted component of type VI protein secretion system